MDFMSIQFRSHTALLLAAALPYLKPAYKHPVELAMKFLELSETMKLYREFPPPDACAKTPLHKTNASASSLSGITELLDRFIQDPEGLLDSLLKVCTGKEKELFGMLKNLMQAKAFYETYGDVLQGFMSANTEPDLTSPFQKEQNDTLDLLKKLLDEE